MFNRIDIMNAFFMFAAMYQESDSSNIFERLQRLGHVMPDGLSGPDDLSDNAQTIFDRLVIECT